MQTSNKTIQLDLLKANQNNPRLSTTGDHLVESIRSEGLNTRLTCELIGNFYIVWQGNGRLKALQTISEQYPEEFKALFPRGIPCMVIEACDEIERASLQTDHGLVRPVSTCYELILATRILMSAKPSITRGELVDRLAHSLDLCFPIRQPDTVEKLRVARENGTFGKELHNVRAGVIQLLQAGAIGPACIEAHFLALARNEQSILPLTREQIASLMKAHNTDLTFKDSTGLCPFTRKDYGPTVLSCIEDIKIKNEIKEGKAVERGEAIKPVTKTTLEQCLKVAESKQVKLLLSIVLGLLPISQLSDLDKELAK